MQETWSTVSLNSSAHTTPGSYKKGNHSQAQVSRQGGNVLGNKILHSIDLYTPSFYVSSYASPNNFTSTRTVIEVVLFFRFFCFDTDPSPGLTGWKALKEDQFYQNGKKIISSVLYKQFAKNTSNLFCL